MKPTVVIYPVAGVGHIMPMVELAKLFLSHDFDVSVVLMHTTSKHPSIDPFLARTFATHPALSFHQLPPPPAHPRTTRSLDVVRFNNVELLRFMTTLQSTADVRVVFLDYFCFDAHEVTTELRLPAYFFFTSGAAILGVFLHFPVLHASSDFNFDELGDTPLHFPGLPPLPASHLHRDLMPPDDVYFKQMLSVFQGLADGDAILINSFESLEAEAVRVLREGLCLPGRRMPSIYCIGPLISEAKEKNETVKCLSWLDTQPQGSVVLLSFGSLGYFSEEQLKQIATGLERSAQRFLWVVRPPPSGTRSPPSHPGLEHLLPEGFLERTAEQGLVVTTWVPQVEVLNHDAVGGFVTHCGWNSVLEAITAGVPMVALPLYADQWTNKVLLVEQMQLAVAMEGYDEDMVTAEEVEKKVRFLMEAEKGRELRARVAAAKESASAAWGEEGSSRRDWLLVLEALGVRARFTRFGPSPGPSKEQRPNPRFSLQPSARSSRATEPWRATTVSSPQDTDADEIIGDGTLDATSSMGGGCPK